MNIDIYVNGSTGNDNGSGSSVNPFLTLAHAQTVARSLASSLSRSITIGIQGTVFNASTLALTSSDNGLTITGIGNTANVISGGVQVKNWALTALGTNIWGAALSTFTRNVWVDGDMARRVVSHGSSPFSGTAFTGTTGYTSTSGYLSGIYNNQYAEAITRNAWFENRVCVSSVSGNSITMDSPAQANLHDDLYNNASGTLWLPNYFENNYADFIAQASITPYKSLFYYDPTAGILYLMPIDGRDPNTSVVIAGTLTNIITITGATDIIIENVAVSHSTWNPNTPNTFGDSTTGPSSVNGYVDIQAGVYCPGSGYGNAGGVPGTPTGKTFRQMPKMPAAVTISGSSSIQVNNSQLTRNGVAGLTIGAGSSSVGVVGNIISENSGTGVYVGDPSDIQTLIQNDNITVENNYIYKIGQEFHDCCGICAFYSTNSNYNNNLGSTNPYTFISIGWGWAFPNTLPNSTIQKNNNCNNNSIQNCQSVLSDAGGIYYVSWQNGLTVENNWINGSASGNANGAIQGQFNNGLYCELGTRGVTAENNVIENCYNNDLNIGPVYGDLIIQNNWFGDGPTSISNQANGSSTNVNGGVAPNGTNGAVYFTLGTNYYNALGSAAQAVRASAGLQSSYQYLTSVKW